VSLHEGCWNEERQSHSLGLQIRQLVSLHLYQSTSNSRHFVDPSIAPQNLLSPQYTIGHSRISALARLKSTPTICSNFNTRNRMKASNVDMGALPVGVNFHSGQVRESTYVGWTAGHKLVLVHFPEQ
jgi:hypothetical protein